MPPPLDSQNSQTFHLQNLVNALQKENESFLEENEKVKRYFNELFESIKVSRNKNNEQVASLQKEIENLKSQVKGKMPMTNGENGASKVHGYNKYALSVKYVPPHLRNNKLAIQTYFSYLKDNLECLREIVEEDKLEKPLDNAIGHACLYAERSQELLECLITI